MELVERRRRELASAVKRLRVAAMSDVTRTPELADALSDLTAVHLLAHDLAEAATTAPEAVVLAARILAAGGPAGPYASLADAARYLAASARLAAVQAGLAHEAAAARTLEGVDAWRGQVSRLPLADAVPDDAVLWMLVARVRAALATDPAAANAWADAAELRLHGSSGVAPFLAMAVHLATADARWAAGRVESCLAHSRLALDAYHEATAGRTPAARRPAVDRAVAAPTPAVYDTYASRLAATGDAALGIALRREQVAVLEALGSELLPAARAALGSALLAAGRPEEAGADATPTVPTAPGPWQEWEPVPGTAALARRDPDPEADARWRRAEHAAGVAQATARADAEQQEGRLRDRARADAARRAAEQADAARRAREQAEAAAEAARAAQAAAAAEAAERAAREEEASRRAAEQRRRELAEQHRASVDPAVAAAAAAELEVARAAVRTARGDAALASAQDRLASLLRPLAAADPAYRDELAETLESLVGLLWRLGDAESSRAAAREAKALGG